MHRSITLRGRRSLLASLPALLAPGSLRAARDGAQADPLDSPQWPSLRRAYLANAPIRFSDAVIVHTPGFADDPMNVPLQVDARDLAATAGDIRRILVLVDLNPIREVLSFEPLRARPMLAFRIRMEQASPVRALAQTQDGRWHVGGAWVQAAGGGCTVPGATRADGSWKTTLNQVQARFFNDMAGDSRRLRVRVMHPMDTGLVAGVPAFHVERLELIDASGTLWWRLMLHEPVSENPLITFEMPRQGPSVFRLRGQDNNGNRVDFELRA